MKAVALSGIVAAFVMRATLGVEGGSPGAWIGFGLFWGCLLGLFILFLVDAVRSWRAGDRVRAIRWALAAAALVALFVDVLIVLILGVSALFVRDWRGEPRAT